MSIFIDCLTDLGLDAGKGFSAHKLSDYEAKKAMKEYIEQQSKIQELSDLAEEIDFQGITDYLTNRFLEDVRAYLSSEESKRETIKTKILQRAYECSDAKSPARRQKTEYLVANALDILRHYYLSKADNDDVYLARDAAHSVISASSRQHEAQTDTLLREMEYGKQEIIDTIKQKQELCREGAAEKPIFRTLHDFVMANYIKERYKKEELEPEDINNYSELFKLTIDICHNKGKVEVTKNLFDFIREDILVRKKDNLIKIKGPDGTGKSTFLSILYIYLYNYCRKNGFSFYPFYINLHFYDIKISDMPSDEQQIKDRMYGDLEQLKHLTQANPELPYIIIIDGNEDYFRTTLKSAKYFNDFISDLPGQKKIVCIGEKTNVHYCRERKKYTYMYSKMLYTFQFRPIAKNDKQKWEKFIRLFAAVEGNDELTSHIDSYLEKFDLEEVDLNILSVFKNCYDRDTLDESNSLTDLYENYCLAYLDDTDEFEDSAKMSFEYFMTNKKFTQEEIAKKHRKWNLIHQHKTISNFLIAYHYIQILKDYNGNTGTNRLEYLFPLDINIFIKPLINEDAETQELILDKCRKIYSEGGILAKSQAIYMMGRIRNKNLKEKILDILERYYEQLYEQNIRNATSQNEQEQWDGHLLLRSVIISLIYLGRKDKREAYLKILLDYPAANQINRSFHLEYYGDIPRKPGSTVNYYNDDGSGSMEITYDILLNRVRRYLSSRKWIEDLNFQINLFTLCSLVQVRLGTPKVTEKQIQKLKNIINTTLQEEQSNLNKDFKAYLTMLKEDIERSAYKPSCLYEKLYGIKSIERSGWKKGIKNPQPGQQFENVVEHTYYAWLLGRLYLPEEAPKEREYKFYDKTQILDTVLIHDWAEIDVGDAIPEENSDEHKELEDFRMRVLLMHDTYAQIENMSQLKKFWNVYGKDSRNINGVIAYELDKIQALYQFYVYLNNGAQFTEEKIQNWKNEKNKITTSLGKNILKEVVLKKFETNS